jgi:dihydroorotase-like cyclic amidohydrolase
MTQTLLKNARLIDGLADQPQERMSILIDGERIAKVESGTCRHQQARKPSTWEARPCSLV